MDENNEYQNRNNQNTGAHMSPNYGGYDQGNSYQEITNIQGENCPGNEMHSSRDQPGRNAAIASLVLGIISIVFWALGIGAFVGLVTGILGAICASNAQKAGFTGGIQIGGFVCSIIGIAGSAVVFIACVACVGAVGKIGSLF